MLRQHPFKLEKWLFIKADIRNVFDGDSLALKTILNGIQWKRSVVLFPCKPLLFRSSNYIPFFNQCGRCIMIIAAYPQYIHVKIASSILFFASFLSSILTNRIVLRSFFLGNAFQTLLH